MLTTILVVTALAVICLEFYTVFKARAETKIWNNIREMGENHERI